MANYSFGINPIPDVKDGHTFTGDNFLQAVPHTKILEGKKEITFINCNLTNCDIPAGAKMIECTNPQISFCSHLHPKWAEKAVIAECHEDCSHLVSKEKVMIDGVEIETVKVYDDIGGR